MAYCVNCHHKLLWVTRRMLPFMLISFLTTCIHFPPTQLSTDSKFFAGNPGYGVLESPLSPGTPMGPPPEVPPLKSQLSSSSSTPSTPNYVNLNPSPNSQKPPPHDYIRRNDSMAGGRTRLPRQVSQRSTTSSEFQSVRDPYPYRGSSKGSYRQINTDMTTLTGSYRGSTPG